MVITDFARYGRWPTGICSACRLVEAKRDCTKHQVIKSPLGLVVMTQKHGQGLQEAFSEECLTKGPVGFIS